MKTTRIGIIGAGLIGGKRASAIVKTKRGTLVAVADLDLARAEALANQYGVKAMKDWRALVNSKEVDAVVIAVPNASLAPIAIAALKAGKHILCEKPFGISVSESRAMLAASRKAKRVVKVGFNHRFHAGIMKAHELFSQGAIGKVLFIRARYGHGGRKGMEKEWRFDKKISGGGELLDQGVHIVDLARWFGGEFKTAYGLAPTMFWDTKLDDNAFAILSNKNVVAQFHVSTTNWRNLFSFEVFGDNGYLEITGKGGSYGEEVLIYGEKNLGFAPHIQEFRFGAHDESWDREWVNFMDAVEKHKKTSGDAVDGLRANELVEAIYRSSKQRSEVKVKLT